MEVIKEEPLDIDAIKIEELKESSIVQELPLKIGDNQSFADPMINSTKIKKEPIHYVCNQTVNTKPISTIRLKLPQQLLKRKVVLDPNQLVHRCHRCPFKTGTDEDFKRHLENHSLVQIPNRSKKCVLCKFMSEDLGILKEHMEEIHKIKVNDSIFYAKQNKIEAHLKVFKCEFCYYKTFHEIDFCKHMSNHTGYSLYQCPDCPFKTRSIDNFNLHKQNHLSAKKRMCMFCEFYTIDEEILKQHIAETHKVIVNDVAVKEREKQTFWLPKKPQKQPAPEEVLECSSCKFTFIEESKFNDHQKNCGISLVINPLKCKICKYETTVKKDYSKHMESHMNHHECSRCGYKTIYKAKFDTHMKNHLNSEVKYRCAYCSYSVKRKHNLVPHIKAHFQNKQRKNVHVKPSTTEKVLSIKKSNK